MTCFNKTFSRGLIMMALLLSACGPQTLTATQSKTAEPPRTDAPPIPVVDASVAQSNSGEQIYSDRLRLEQADLSCRETDPRSFFDSFIGSAAVQQKYAAPTIAFLDESDPREARERSIARKDWPGSPIMMVDYDRKPTLPARAGDKDEYVMIRVNQSQSNQILIEWTRVHFDGRSEGGDDRGNAFDLDGQPYDPAKPGDGELLFEPTGDCWQLVADRRFARRGAR